MSFDTVKFEDVIVTPNGQIPVDISQVQTADEVVPRLSSVARKSRTAAYIASLTESGGAKATKTAKISESKPLNTKAVTKVQSNEDALKSQKKANYDNDLTIENLREYMFEIGISNIDVAIKQVLVNTQNLTQITNNNLFDMKMPKKRHTTAVRSDKRGMAMFISWQAAVDDFKHWQTALRFEQSLSPQQYVSRLRDVSYKTDSNYFNQLI
jgi:hypothetical protein